MSKRGQVTVFIIIGIIIVIIVGISIFIGMGYTKSNFLNEIINLQSVPADVQPVKEKVQGCFDEVSVAGLVLLGRQGGYYELPTGSIVDFSIDDYVGFNSFYLDQRAYYFANGRTMLPKLPKIQEQYNQLISKNMLICVNEGFEEFRNQSYNFVVKRPEITVQFNTKNTIINMNFPITVKKDDTEFVLNKFSNKLDFDFITKYKLVEQIISEQEKDPNYLPLSFITNLAYDNNFTFEINEMEIEKNDKLITLIFDEPIGEFEKFEYSFVIGYE